ncbi:ureidoglycolate lyase [Ancylobacter sp. A5.8]|uniref:ureidoglycolate lyase n=1 Tax=Ancylobacter gelatini TaxID=2919920 RepID=UPI001F4DCA3A|nr:ureidoglycolate lyase [Ancylobacter gelatini]MCJ8145251.1 ureidoglycolate lyase [Ancylobacter gelatini]
MRDLTPGPLDPDSFAPFGQVLAFDPANALAVNDGWALRSNLAARLEPAGAGVPTLAVFRARCHRLPAAIGFLECHPHSSQAFLPMAPQRFLIVVAPESKAGGPDLAQARAFLGAAGQGVNYRRGVWHAPITAIDADTDFLMLIWEHGMADDTIVHRLAHPIHVRPLQTSGPAVEETLHDA